VSVRVLVTGGAGFLGSHLCERLLALGAEVVCLDDFSTAAPHNVDHLADHPRFEVVRADVVEPIRVEADQVFHLACPASPVHYQRDPVRTIRTAVHGTLNALDRAREVGARILIASTSEVYGDPEQHPQPETYWGNVNPIGPRACYDEGKRCAEALAVSYARQYGVATRIARIFNCYGPRMHEHDGRVVSNFVGQALRGEPLTVYGDGAQTRSFCYVTDMVDALLALMAADADPGPINLGNPKEHTIRELAELTLRLTGSRAGIVEGPLPVDDPVQRCPDIARARELLGWEPVIALEDGLRDVIGYFRETTIPRSG
jgi:UDP-glucuronate decarboxylase